MKKILTITTEDYSNATKYSNPFSCPMAIAAQRLFPSAQLIACSLGSVTVYNSFSIEYWNVDASQWDAPFNSTFEINERIAAAKQGIKQKTLTFIIERISIVENPQ